MFFDYLNLHTPTLPYNCQSVLGFYELMMSHESYRLYSLFFIHSFFFLLHWLNNLNDLPSSSLIVSSAWSSLLLKLSTEFFSSGIVFFRCGISICVIGFLIVSISALNSFCSCSVLLIYFFCLHVHEFGWTLGVGDGQGGLACCNSWGRKESDTTEWLNWTECSCD